MPVVLRIVLALWLGLLACTKAAVIECDSFLICWDKSNFSFCSVVDGRLTYDNFTCPTGYACSMEDEFEPCHLEPTSPTTKTTPTKTTRTTTTPTPTTTKLTPTITTTTPATTTTTPIRTTTTPATTTPIPTKTTTTPATTTPTPTKTTTTPATTTPIPTKTTTTPATTTPIPTKTTTTPATTTPIPAPSTITPSPSPSPYPPPQCKRSGTYPAPQCNQYYVCLWSIFGYVRELRTCVWEKVYSIDLKVCVSKSLVDCGSRTYPGDDSDPSCDATSTAPSCYSLGNYPTASCYEYFACVPTPCGYKAIIHNCPYGFAYSNSLRNCVPIAMSDCNNEDSNPTDCMGPGYFPAYDCSKYYSCEQASSGFELRLKSCPRSLLFSKEHGICLPSCMVQCS